MRRTFTLALAILLELIALGGLSDANAQSRLEYRHHAERTGAYWRHYGSRVPTARSP